MVYLIYSAMEAVLKKILALPLVFLSFSSFAEVVPTTEVQPYPEYLADYVKTLITAGCEQTLKGGSEDVLIKRATEGMKKGTASYDNVHNAIVLGAGFGNGLKEKGKLITKEKIAIDSCGGAAAYTMMQKEFIKTVVASMTNLEQSQVADSKPKVPASDDGIYRTTAKTLAELYSANEVAADDKIGGRNVEITGVVQDITKNFTDDVVLKLESGNRFMPVSLSMEGSEKPQASKLRKGQKIVVTCGKMQLFIGAPSGSNCKFN
ncbi:TPA: OB-fold putative lipoprotein [Klebsiella variicola]|uniref:OB-fold putative lipoprotein n=1 Tax=Klebsiella variicola TaxID=244366 RepID=UPI00215AE96A|nr:OB-fold putative lipoprotein [Klebsiella variicola]